MTNIIFERTWAMPNGNTFIIAPIKDFVEQEVNNVVNKVIKALAFRYKAKIRD